MVLAFFGCGEDTSVNSNYDITKYGNKPKGESDIDCPIRIIAIMPKPYAGEKEYIIIKNFSDKTIELFLLEIGTKYIPANYSDGGVQLIKDLKPGDNYKYNSSNFFNDSSDIITARIESFNYIGEKSIDFYENKNNIFQKIQYSNPQNGIEIRLDK